jgi:hypothetical protein
VRGQRANPISLSIFSELLKAGVVHCHQQHMLASSFAAAFCRLTRRRVFVTDLGGGGFDVSAYVSTDSWYHGHLQSNLPKTSIVFPGFFRLVCQGTAAQFSRPFWYLSARIPITRDAAILAL